MRYIIAAVILVAAIISTGFYEPVTITGKGPNGTPVHKRNVTLVVGLVIPVELTELKRMLQVRSV